MIHLKYIKIIIMKVAKEMFSGIIMNVGKIVAYDDLKSILSIQTTIKI